MTTVVSSSDLLAERFLRQHCEYFFAGSHHLVEAAAQLAATELAPNRFEFPDGSVLEIQHHRAQVVVHRHQSECGTHAPQPWA